MSWRNRTTIFILVFVFLAGAVLYFWSARPAVPPEITVTTPAGGEKWQPGEEHVISWSTKGVPAGYKVAVTIRRIPPPPLLEEGQEFDPIIFTDLPNTGSASWKISPMYPNGTYVIGMNAYESVPVMSPISAESGQFTLTHPELSAALYPLYSGADWNAPEAESFLIGTTAYSGASVASFASAETMDPGSVFTSFDNFYDKKLKSLGWSVANDLAAGGHVGGQTGYHKDGEIILTRFHIEYLTKPENAPSECPCDVTLSLFSTSPQ